MLAKILFVMVIISGLATLGMLFAGLISMSRNVDGNIEGGDLSARMHPRVGASRTMNPDIHAKDLCECGFEPGLDRVLAGL